MDGNFSGSLLARLQTDAARHQINTTKCGVCSAADKSECVPEAALRGQKPEYLMMFDARGGLNPSEADGIFGVRPPSVFSVSASPWVIPPPWGASGQPNALPNASLAALQYGVDHLKIPHVVLFITNKNPTAALIVTAVEHQECGASMQLWQPQFKTVIDAVSQTAQTLKIVDHDELKALAAMALLQNNARNVLDYVRSKHGHTVVAPLYLNRDSGAIHVVDPRAELTAQFNATAREILRVPSYISTEPSLLALSCCDARANHHHVTPGKPGEYLNHHLIAGIVPPYEQSLRHPNSTWPLIEAAFERNPERPIMLLRHSHCGGIKAGLNRVKNSTSVGAFIDPWLAQADSVLKQVVVFANQNGIAGENLVNLADMEVGKWSARNIAAHTGRMPAVFFLEIDTRNIQVVNPAATIAETYRQSVQQPEYFHYDVPPPNVKAPPQVCPPMNHGIVRMAHPNRARLERLVHSAANLSCNLHWRLG